MIKYKNKKYHKNIFVKNNDPIETNTDKDNLSDESNKLDKPDNILKQKNFNILDIYEQINKLLINNYSECEITGEIISFKITGEHAWMDLKFEEFQIKGIFWNITQYKNFQSIESIKLGDKYMFKGKFSVMRKNLNIYFNIKSLEKFGKGDYLDIYHGYRLKIKELELDKHKKQLEIFPYNIGIITAMGGAAIQDILQVLKLDKFVGKIIIKNTLVQGSQCPKSIINSIEWFENNYTISQIDLLMITRGGGGWDDLVGFSDWDLQIKISQLKFITLSAVGHHIDNQLTDEVCDYKFATPSHAAKFIVESQAKYKLYLLKCNNELKQIISTFINLKTKFNYSIVNNYTNIIKKYDIKQIMLKVKRYSSQINFMLNKYNHLKNTFYSKLSNLKPTIIRKKELTTIDDFIDPITNIEIKPKKIEIYFIDGMVGLSYKINAYEKYN